MYIKWALVLHAKYEFNLTQTIYYICRLLYQLRKLLAKMKKKYVQSKNLFDWFFFIIIVYYTQNYKALKLKKKIFGWYGVISCINLDSISPLSFCR